MHGNFVMQKLIQTLSPSALGFMIHELKESIGSTDKKQKTHLPDIQDVSVCVL